MQKTYIIDTNVYGELLIEQEGIEIIVGIKEDKTVYVYGVDVIEKELEESPIGIKFKGKLLRKAVLTIYNTIIDEELKLFPIAKYVSSKYYEKFDELRKSGKHYKLISSKVKKYNEDDLKIDFQIIAMASLKGIDIVVSKDKRTMLSKLAEETYKIINSINGLRTPKLVKYSDFRERYIKWIY